MYLNTIPGLGLILWVYISAIREQSDTSCLFLIASNSRRASWVLPENQNYEVKIVLCAKQEFKTYGNV